MRCDVLSNDTAIRHCLEPPHPDPIKNKKTEHIQEVSVCV